MSDHMQPIRPNILEEHIKMWDEFRARQIHEQGARPSADSGYGTNNHAAPSVHRVSRLPDQHNAKKSHWEDTKQSLAHWNIFRPENGYQYCGDVNSTVAAMLGEAKKENAARETVQNRIDDCEASIDGDAQLASIEAAARTLGVEGKLAVDSATQLACTENAAVEIAARITGSYEACKLAVLSVDGMGLDLRYIGTLQDVGTKKTSGEQQIDRKTAAVLKRLEEVKAQLSIKHHTLPQKYIEYSEKARAWGLPGILNLEEFKLRLRKLGIEH